MNCVKCGKPVIHGVGGYAGPQCMCWASPAPTGPLLDVTETLMQQSMEITRLRAGFAASQAECERLRAALEKIAWGRKPGALKNKLAEKYERIAIDAARAGKGE